MKPIFANPDEMMSTVSNLSEVATKDNFMNIPFFDSAIFLQLIMKFCFNMLICWLIIQLFYYKRGGRRDFYFTFLLFSVTIFLLIFLLDNVKQESINHYIYKHRDITEERRSELTINKLPTL